MIVWVRVFDPDGPSTARQALEFAHTYAPYAQTKQDFAQRREESGCSRPRGERLPLPKAYPEAEWQSMAVGLEIYTAESRADAGTALVLAHSRRASISSARVVERGTVWANASISDWVVTGIFSE